MNLILAQLVPTSVVRQEAVATLEVVMLYVLYVFYVLHGSVLLLFFQLLSDSQIDSEPVY